jgi:hypothetical protein
MSRRVWLAPALGALAFVLAIAAGLGPAKSRQVHVSWPAAAGAADRTGTVSSTFDLTRREPDRLTIDVPCGAGAGETGLVLATTPDTEAPRGLVLERQGTSLAVRQGRTPIAELPRPRAGPSCRWRVEAVGSSLSATSADGATQTYALTDPVLVDGVYGVETRGREPPRVELVARVPGSSPTLRQILLGLAALVLAATACWLAIRPRPRVRRPLKRWWRAVREVDAIVVGTILVSWIAGPAFFDDGWVRIRLMNFAASGAFSNYYDVNGASLPQGYWLDWPMHWLAQATNVVPLLRLPAVVSILLGWGVCRWALRRGLDSEPSAPTRFALAAVYLVGSVAWLVTLRPEPFVALLAILSLSAALSFVHRPSAAPLLVGACLTALAVSLHPAGFVVLAPLVAASPLVVRWLLGNPTRRGPQLAVVGLAALTLVVLLVTLDSDFHRLAYDTREFRSGGEHLGNWRDELRRYSALDTTTYHTPPRRLFVFLAVLAVVAYAARRDRVRHWSLDLPALSTIAALVFLAVTPSKWPWHFGTLVGLAAVAFAVELARFLRFDGVSRLGAIVRSALAVILVVLGTTWAWVNPTPWNVLDLRAHEPTVRLGALDVASLKYWVAALVLVFAVLSAWSLLRRRAVGDVPRQVAAWIVPVVSALVIAVSLGTTIDDAAGFPGWTLARQSVDGLLGRETCGLGDEAVLPDPSTLRALVGPSGAIAAAPGRWLTDDRPLAGLATWDSSGATGGLATLQTGWYPVERARRIGLFLAGGSSDDVKLRLEWGRRDDGDVRAVRSDPVDLPAARESPVTRWRLLAASDLPPKPDGATHVRVVADDRDPDPAAWIGVSAPVSYVPTSLGGLARRTRATLVHPALNLYLPCARQPRLANGRVDQPGLLVLKGDSRFPIGTDSSPFGDLDTTARLIELPLDDSPNPIDGVQVYAVDWTVRPRERVLPPGLGLREAP